MADHTPTPWKQDQTFVAWSDPDIICLLADTNIGGSSGDVKVANAAFIVKACNAHDALVAALKLALPILLTADDDAAPRLAERISAAEEALRMVGAIR